MNGFEQISPALVIGTGLVGASVGCAMTAKGVRVHLQDAVGAHAVVAAGRGAGTTQPVDRMEVKLVVVAVPPASIADVVAQALADYPNAAVTDVGSVKHAIAARLRGVTGVERYVGSHPMAGSALSGPLTAAAELFDDRTWVVTPSEASDGWAIDRVKAMVRTSGARMLIRSAVDHDRAVAEVSHLPQLMSSLTAAQLGQVPAEDLALAGQGVRDVTRIAGSDPDLWRQIVAGNAGHIRDQLVAVQADLARLIEHLDDPATVADLIARGQRGAAALPSRAGKNPKLFVAVSVAIPDAPGAMARLFSDMSELKINIEDVSIEHDPQRRAGYLILEVQPRQVDALRAMLRAKGWVHEPVGE